MSRPAAAVALLALALSCCAAPQRTTRMTIGDLDAMAQQMADSFARSPAFRDRTPQSEPWVVSIDKVQNLTSDVMTRGEQWAVIARLRGAMPIQALAQQRHIRFVIPPEQARAMRDNAELETFGDAFASEREVTHTMAATFRSVTRMVAERRTDLYYAEFEVLDLATGVPVWTDRFEYKRAARGHVWD